MKMRCDFFDLLDLRVGLIDIIQNVAQNIRDVDSRQEQSIPVFFQQPKKPQKRMKLLQLVLCIAAQSVEVRGQLAQTSAICAYLSKELVFFQKVCDAGAFGNIKPKTIVIVLTGRTVNAIVDIPGCGDNRVTRLNVIKVVAYQKGNIAGYVDVDFVTIVCVGIVRCVFIYTNMRCAVRTQKLHRLQSQCVGKGHLETHGILLAEKPLR